MKKTLMAVAVCACVLVSGWAAERGPCHLEKRESPGKPAIWSLENDFLRVELDVARDGGIARLFFKPVATELTIPPEQVGGEPSLQDRIWRQVVDKGATLIEIEYFKTYSATPTVMKDTPEEVSVSMSCAAASSAFPGLVVRKTYTLKRDSCALVLDHSLENTSTLPLKAGIWAQTYFRSSGRFAERNSYFSPTPTGLRVISHPGKNASEQGDWVLEPTAGWHAIVGGASRSGLAAVFDFVPLSSFYDWYSKNKMISSFEWMIREQDIPAKQAFTTRCVFIPFQDFKRVDSVVADTFPVGISLSKIRPEPGEMVEFAVTAATVERARVALTVAWVPSGSNTGGATELLAKELDLEPGVTSRGEGHFRAPPEGAYVFEVRLSKEGKVLGSVSRPFAVGKAELGVRTEPAVVSHVGEKFLLPVLHQHLQGYEQITISPVTGVKRVSEPTGSKAKTEPTATPQQADEARARKVYPPLDMMFAVDESVVTPHTPWSKPSASGPVKLLYLAQMVWTVDTVKRNVVELRQRMDLDYKFVPLLRRIKSFSGNNGMIDDTYENGLEPYIVDVVGQELTKPYQAVVVHNLDFGQSGEAITPLLLAAATNGKGIVLIDCKNLPSAISNALTQGAVVAPDSFACLPVIEKTPSGPKAMAGICKLATYGQGRIATISTAKNLYPCVPAQNRGDAFPNYEGRELPYWEYMYLPLMKTIAWAAGQHPVATAHATQMTNGTIRVAISADRAGVATLDVVFRDEFGQIETHRTWPVKFAPEGTTVTCELPALDGGLHLADYRLLTDHGAVFDYGSLRVEIPVPCAIKSLAFDKRCYATSDTVSATVTLENLPADVTLETVVEDTLGRKVYRAEHPVAQSQSEATVSFQIVRPLTVLHRLTLSVKQGDRVLARKMAEFSMPFELPPDDDYLAYVWYGRAQGLKRWKDIGFDSVIVSGKPQLNGLNKALCNMNLRPYSYGLGRSIGSSCHKGDAHYFGPDLVRDPCFSDPVRWRKLRDAILPQAEQDAYFGCFEYQLTDEIQMGPNVCFSSHCLTDFRAWLQQRYSSLEALNREWNTAFASWDVVTPLSTPEVSDEQANLMSWVDHRMFMTGVFANWVKRNKEIVREKNPTARMGLSGTGNPNTTYNWWELMKSVDFLASYGGIQEELIASFAGSGVRVGAWTGGYQPAHVFAEKYERCAPWAQLFGGCNAYFFFHASPSGTSLQGDLTFNRNTLTAASEVAEIKRGMAKLLLSSKRLRDGIALHYSQNSLFVCDALLGSQYWSQSLDSWKFLLNDMGLDFRFVAYEQLESEPLDPARYKVFVLPLSVSLSQKEIANLRRYVQQGGVLIADYAPGLCDEHGKRIENADLLELFGVTREHSDVRMQGCDLKVTADPAQQLAARTLLIRYGEEGLRLNSGKAFADSGNPKAPAVIVNNFGQGRGILLNCVLGDYAQVTLGGQGGETSEIGRGDPAITTPMRELVANVLAGCGIVPQVKLTTQEGRDFQPLSRTVRYAEGAARYVGVIKPDMGASEIKPSEAVPIRICFEKEGHVYDVRKGKYLGQCRDVKTALTPALAQLYAILPYRVKAIDAQATGRFSPGDVVSLAVAIEASEKEVGAHVLHVEVIGPDQQPRPHYAANIKIAYGRGMVSIPTALNDPKGRWTVQLRDVASGVHTKMRYDLK